MLPQHATPRPALFRTWLKFWLILAVLTFTLRLLADAWMVPEGLWPRAWWWGLRFDLAISALLAGITLLAMWPASRLLPRLPRRGWLVPALLVLLGAHLGDWLYWQEAGRHVSYEVRELFNSAGSLLGMLQARWPWLLGVLAVLVLGSRVSWVPSRNAKPGLRPEIAMLGVIALSVLVVRGGITDLPQDPHQVVRLGDASEATAALNGAYAALYGFTTSGHGLSPPHLNWLSRETALQRVQQLYAGDASAPAIGKPRPINVVVVLLESWSTAHSRPLSDGTPVTPNFHAVAADSLSTDTLISGGMRTTEGMFSVFCSFQNPLGRSVAETQLAMHDYGCLPRLLSDAGWDSAFFQGSHEDTSGTGSFSQLLGFQASYGKTDIEERSRPENYWGVYDQDLYRSVLKRMDHMTEPMLIGINTNTTHDTQLPDDVAPLIDSNAREDQSRNVIHLADAELGDFVQGLKARDWQHPWMLVLVADHTTRVEGSNFSRFRLPFALYAPGLVDPGKISRVAHQRDIAPTLASLIGVDMPQAMGHSLLDPEAPSIAEYYISGTQGWFAGDTLIEYSLNAPSTKQCFDWQRDPALTSPIPCQPTASDAVRDAYSLTQVAQRALFAGEAQQFGATAGSTQTQTASLANE